MRNGFRSPPPGELQRSILDALPSRCRAGGRRFELEVDQNGVAHVFTPEPSPEMLFCFGLMGLSTTRILLTDGDLVDALGMDLDANNIEQVATASQPVQPSPSTQFVPRRSRHGRVDPTPQDARQGEEDEQEGSMLLADLNHDGFDDLVVATPEANLLSLLTTMGMCTTVLRRVCRPSDVILAGDGSGAHYGAGMDQGDFNNDGIMDLAIGAPGWADVNDANARHGQVHVYLGNVSGLDSTPWATILGADNESLGSAVEALLHTGGGDHLAVTARNYSMETGSSQTDTGKVNLYSSDETGLSPLRNLTQTKAGDLFGRSLEGCDVNSDGFDELIVGNTGSFEDALSYSSVEYYYGSSTGYNGTPDHTLASLTQGRLFGLIVACVGDLNGDAYDEHIITEPLNSTSTFGAGLLWLFEGTNGTLPSEADWQFEPTTPNTQVGEAIVAAGDINEDGYDDVYISSRMGSSSGRVEFSSVQPTESATSVNCSLKATAASNSVR